MDDDKRIDSTNGEERSPETSGEVRHEGLTGEAPVGKTARLTAAVAGDLLTNIRLGLRLACLLKVKPEELRSSPGAFASLAVFEILLALAISVAQVGPDGHLVPAALVYAVFPLPLMLLAGLCVARLARRPELALALPAACLSLAVPLDLLGALLQSLPKTGNGGRLTSLYGHYYPLFFWWMLAALIATRRMAAVKEKGRRLAVPLLLAGILLVPLWNIERQELWRENAGPGDDSEYSQVADEQFIYHQPAMLERELDSLLPGRKGVVDLYFVGFAGDGSQDVFRKEIDVIEPLFRERFDTTGRSLVLINNPATVRTYPVATATALERALERVGQVMDRDEDILFLYLTSHGSPDHHLTTQLWPLELRDIEPGMLKRALDESGITWRVVVVSACYSGGFLEPLKDANTLIMTASDAENSSFGCSDDSDFTWFGKALFDQELRRTYSFPAAFKQASASIALREQNEGEDPSHPQMYLGENIRQRLPLLESRLKALEQAKRQRKTE